MKSGYGKTYANTSISGFRERLRSRLHDLSFIFDAFLKRPCLLPALLTAVTVFLCFYLESYMPVIPVCFIAAGYCFSISRKRAEMKHSILLACMIFCLVLIHTGTYIDSRLKLYAAKTGSGQYACVVTTVSYDLSGGIDMTVKLDNGVIAKATFYKEVPQNVSAGDSLVLFGKLKEPESPGNPGEFDYKSYLRSKGILYVISCERAETTAKAGFPLSITGSIQRKLFEFKKASVEAVSGSFGYSERALTAAVCTGDKSLISTDTKRDFKLSCCSHLLAVSGTHFSGFLAGLPVILDLLKIKRRKALIIYGLFAISVGCFTGWSDSVTRAAFMSICIYAMRDWVSALSIASMVMVIADPFCPLSSGFQMSFCAVIAIKMYSGKLTEFLKKLHLGDFLSGILSPSIAASLGMIPFWSDISMKPDLEHLALQTAGSFVTQLICIFFVPSVILCFILPFWSQYISSPLLLCVYALQKVIAFGGSMGEKSGAPVHLSKAFLIFVAAAVFLYLLPSSLIKRGLLKLSVSVLAFFIGFEAAGLLNRSVCTVVFTDVGQGDCCLIITSGLTCLIDGGTYDEGASAVSDLLDYYGIYQVDICIMSHWDVDHAGGIAALYERGRTKTIITSYVPATSEEDKDVQEFFEFVGFDDSSRTSFLSCIEQASSGDRILLSEPVYIDILYPVSGASGGNEESLVAMLHIEGKEDTSILFTGDIGINTEAILVKTGIELDCDILKVAHHGSKYSSSPLFIEACSPEIAVISVGKNNFYGHPTPDTLERLDSYGCKVFRTDLEGAVIMNY